MLTSCSKSLLDSLMLMRLLLWGFDREEIIHQSYELKNCIYMNRTTVQRRVENTIRLLCILKQPQAMKELTCLSNDSKIHQNYILTKKLLAILPCSNTFSYPIHKACRHYGDSRIHLNWWKYHSTILVWDKPVNECRCIQHCVGHSSDASTQISCWRRALHLPVEQRPYTRYQQDARGAGKNLKKLSYLKCSLLNSHTEMFVAASCGMIIRKESIRNLTRSSHLLKTKSLMQWPVWAKEWRVAAVGSSALN